MKGTWGGKMSRYPGIRVPNLEMLKSEPMIRSVLTI